MSDSTQYTAEMAADPELSRADMQEIAASAGSPSGSSFQCVAVPGSQRMACWPPGPGSPGSCCGTGFGDDGGYGHPGGF